VSISYATGTTASWTVVSNFVTRLRAGLVDVDSKPTAIVRVISKPDEHQPFKAEEGVHVTVGDPQPIVNDGAGRYGQRVRRVLELYLVTVCLKDAGGREEKSVEKHLALEDAVFNIVSGTPPADSAYNSKVGITLKWIPGGDVIRRAMKSDAGQHVSVHLFEIIYPQHLQVVL